MMPRMRLLMTAWCIGPAMVAALAAADAGLVAAAEVNIYSTRQAYLIEPLLDAFTAETGTKVNVAYLDAGLIERLKREGRNSPADLVLTADIARMSTAKADGLTQPVADAAITAAVPAEFRDPDGHWFGLTARARVIYASRERVQPGEITRYEDLAEPRWAGRVCTRSGHHEYQIALLAAMITHLGDAEAKTWLAGVKANLARKPQGNDRAQIRAIAEGICDVSLGNSYYYGAMMDDPDQAEAARAVNVVFPNQADRGTHVNLSGMALTAAAPNKDDAIALMRFLVGATAQQLYAERNFEYPVRDGVAWSPLLNSLGDFKTDEINLETVAQQRGKAIRLVNEVDYNG